MKQVHSQKHPVVVFGAGGHAKVVVDTIESLPTYCVSCLSDLDEKLHGQFLFSYPIYPQDQVLRDGPKDRQLAFVALGDNDLRKNISSKVMEAGFGFATLIHSSAIVAQETTIGVGTLLAAGSIVNPSVTLGIHVIVNSGAIVEHDCAIEDYVHLGPRSTLCGGVSVGANSLIGAGAVVLPSVKIGQNVIVGAGVVVSKNVPDGSVLRRLTNSN